MDHFFIYIAFKHLENNLDDIFVYSEIRKIHFKIVKALNVFNAFKF